MKLEVNKHWYMEYPNFVVGRERIPMLSTFLNWLGFGRISMTKLYEQVRSTMHENAEMTAVFPQPFDRDHFPRPDKYPRYYQLHGDWSIEKGSVSFIKEGPLFSHDRKAIVPATVFVQSLWQRGWRFIAAVGTLLGSAQGVSWVIGMIPA